MHAGLWQRSKVCNFSDQSNNIHLFHQFHPTQKVLKIGAFTQELKRQMCIKRAGWRCAKQPVSNRVRTRRLTSGWWNRAVMFCEGLEAAHLV